MSADVEYRERRWKRESRQQASEAQREKEWQTARARDKIQRRQLLEEQLENFVVAVGKIRNASGHQGENERQSEKSTRTRTIFPP